MQAAMMIHTLWFAAAVAISTPAASAAPAMGCAAGEVDAEFADALRHARAGDSGPASRMLENERLQGPEQDLLEAQLAALTLQTERKDAALDRYFGSTDRDCGRLASAHRLLAETAFAEGKYALAVEHAAAARSVPAGWTQTELEHLARLEQIAALLAAAPRQQVESRGPGLPVPAVADKAGLWRSTVRTGTASVDAVVDTGANLSVASETTARKMGLVPYGDEASVGNSVGGSVGVRLAVADRLDFAGAVLRNVVFLVIQDQSLSFPVPGGYNIDAIVGLPVLRALGRIRFGPGETLAVLTDTPFGVSHDNLRMVGSDPFIVAEIAGVPTPMFFDSGANGTSLSPRFLATHPQIRPGGSETVHKAGAGGSKQMTQQSFEALPIRIGSAAGMLKNVSAEEAETEEDQRYGTLGIDLLKAFRSVTLDFGAASVEVEP